MDDGTPVAEDDRPSWWQGAVLYQIYPRSFADGNADGVGDLHGIRQRLGYVRALGVDGIWLSPIYRSPMADFGYDVADHCDVDPLFGDLDTFDALLEDCHRAGLRVMLDWVPNHTSAQHPWFLDSRASRRSPKREWYVWRDGVGDDPPNNWLAAFGGRAWTFDEASGQWYLHLFLPDQPDVNWNHPQAAAAQLDVLRFWLARGVDGFRADVVHLIGKDERLPDQPPHLADVNLVGIYDNPRTHELLREVRAVLDQADNDVVMVGEVNLGSAELIAPYYGEGDELHLVFNFALLAAPWDAETWQRVIIDAEAALLPRAAWPVWVLSNHDQKRHRSRYGGSEARARVAAVVLLTLRGTIVLYAGEELGLENAVVAREQRVDPGHRDGCRAPIPWDADAGHGWPVEPWLPFAPEPDRRNAAAMVADPASIFSLYQRLIELRRATAALVEGSWRPISAPPGILAYERARGDERRIVVANFTDAEVEVSLDGTWLVEITSDSPSSGHAWTGSLGPERAAVLRPVTDR